MASQLVFLYVLKSQKGLTEETTISTDYTQTLHCKANKPKDQKICSYMNYIAYISFSENFFFSKYTAIGFNLNVLLLS